MSLMCTAWTDLGNLLPFVAAAQRPLFIGDNTFLAWDAYMVGGGDGRMGISTDKGLTWGFTTGNATLPLGIYFPVYQGNGKVYGAGLTNLGQYAWWYSDDHCATITYSGTTTADAISAFFGIDLGSGIGFHPIYNGTTGQLEDWISQDYGVDPVAFQLVTPRPAQAAPLATDPEMYGIGLGSGRALLSWWGGGAGLHRVYYTEDSAATWNVASDINEYMLSFTDLGAGKVLAVSVAGNIWVSPPGSYGTEWDYLGTLTGGSTVWTPGVITDGVNVGNGKIYAHGYLLDATVTAHYGVLYSDRSGAPGSWKLIEIPAWTAGLAPSFPLASDGKNTFLAAWGGGGGTKITRSNTGGQVSTAAPAGARGGITLANNPIACAGLGARIQYGTQVGGR